jgi:hypothetical protein
MNAKELYQELQAVTQKFHQFANQTEVHGQKSGAGFLSGFKGALGGIGHVFQGALGAIGVSFGLHEVFEGIKSIVEQGARFEDLSRRYGVSVEVLSSLGFQAQKTGTDIEGLAKGIGFLEKNREKALAGDAKLRASFEGLGVSLRDLESLRTEEILTRIGNSSLNAADLFKIMGRSALSLRPLLDDIGRGAVDFGKHLNDADAKKLKEVEDAFINLKQTILTDLAPALASFFIWFGQSWTWASEKLENFLTKKFTKDWTADLDPTTKTAMAHAGQTDNRSWDKTQKDTPPPPLRAPRDFGKADNEAAEGEDKELTRKKDKLEKEERERHLKDISNDQALQELRAEEQTLATKIAQTKEEEDLVDLKTKRLAVLDEIDRVQSKKDREDDKLDKSKDKEHKLEVGALPAQQRRNELLKEAADLKLQEKGASDEQERVDLRTRYLTIEKEIDSLDKGRHARNTAAGGSHGRGAAAGPTTIDARAPHAVVKHGLETGHVEGAHLNDEAPLSLADFRAQFKGRGTGPSNVGARERDAVALAKLEQAERKKFEQPLFPEATKKGPGAFNAAHAAQELALGDLFSKLHVPIQPDRAKQLGIAGKDTKHADALKDAGKELKEAAKVLKGALTNK